MAAILFSILVVVLAAGVLWFHIVRPILESYGVITVNPSQDAASVVMSRSDQESAPSVPSSLQTDSAADRQTANAPAFSRAVMLDTYQLLRRHGVTREEARPVLKALGMGLDNNLWASAATPDDPHITPVAGRSTNAQFDPDYPYRPLEV